MSDPTKAQTDEVFQVLKSQKANKVINPALFLLGRTLI